jgi:hypothetical protein
VIKESTEEIASMKTKSVLEERGEHHNFIQIGCGEVFFGGGAPLQHSAIEKEAIRN